MTACLLPIVLLKSRLILDGHSVKPGFAGVQIETEGKLHIRDSFSLGDGESLRLVDNEADTMRVLELAKQDKVIEKVDLVADFHKWLATRPPGTNEVRYIDTVDKLIPTLGEHIVLSDHSVVGVLDFLRPYSGSPAFAYLCRIRTNPLRMSYEFDLGTPTCYATGAVVWIRRVYETKFGTFVLKENDLCPLSAKGGLGKPKFHIDGEVKGFVLGRYLLLVERKLVPNAPDGSMFPQVTAESLDLATGKVNKFGKAMAETASFVVEDNGHRVYIYGHSSGEKDWPNVPFDVASGKPAKS